MAHSLVANTGGWESNFFFCQPIRVSERQCARSADDVCPAFMKAFVIAYDELHCCYGSKSYRKRSWDAAKAKQGEMGRALEGLVRVVGETMGNKLPDNKQVIVAIGWGNLKPRILAILALPGT
ncbi:hypothetical protein SeMB42_g04620 [Synchytrium endobioticum]|uniref:Uncharacterized protein n=1 Tax=Synchytrium endobioticum TaxID=286115 RepID=A0A507CX42_9FUNG|nr:hypothetical protein SeMB42_g04620 [Synchytrium endobioticum]